MVEGYHDLAKLKKAFDSIDVMITNGSEISDITLQELRQLNDSRGLILFLDPDYQGERIRRIINDFVGETKHAFLPKNKCINYNKTKVGIEHASISDIRNAINKVYTTTNRENHFTQKDLLKWGLMGDKNSKKFRETICNQLGIGLCNAKTLVNKLNMFGIDKEKVEEFLKE